MRRTLASLVLLASPLWILELRRAIPALSGLELFSPDPILLGVAFAALRAEPLAACIFAAVLGALLDLPSGTPFGLGAARLALGAAFLGSLRSQVRADAWVVAPLAVLLFAIASKAVEALVLEACQDVALLPLVGRGALVALATAAATPLLWPAGEALLASAR
ncbi:rod shape-determining protein MreD, partial [bacterium]|nr:rod shape-determining protein MreD [bacterium]